MAACAAIEQKLTQARQKQEQIDALKGRTNNVRQMVKMQTNEQISWKATA